MKRSIHHFSLLFLVLLIFAGCGRSLTGTVYLDLDGDNKKDDGESKIAGVRINVTVDDKDEDEATTDANGEFDLDMDKEGTYCVIVDTNDLITASGLVASADNFPALDFNFERISDFLSPLFIIPEAFALTGTCPGGAITTGNDDNGDGNVDCRDLSCATDTTCKETSCTNGVDDNPGGANGKKDCEDPGCQADKTACPTTTTGTCSKDSSGKPVCSDANCANESACKDSGTDTDTDTAESGKACKDSKGFELTLDVPIAMDYESQVDLVNDAEITLDFGGSSKNISIAFPSSCTVFKNFSLGDKITPTSPASAISASVYNETTGSFDLNDATTAVDAVLTSSASGKVGEDDLTIYTFAIEAADDGSTLEASSEVTLEPVAVCPDDSEVTLNKNTVTINMNEAFTVSIGQNPISPAEQTDFTITATVNNNLARAFTGVELRLVLSDVTILETPTGGSITAGTCAFAGSTITCTNFDLAASDGAAGGSDSETFTFTLRSEDLTSNKPLTLTPTIEVDNVDFEKDASDTITITGS